MTLKRKFSVEEEKPGLAQLNWKCPVQFSSLFVILATTQHMFTQNDTHTQTHKHTFARTHTARDMSDDFRRNLKNRFSWQPYIHRLTSVTSQSHHRSVLQSSAFVLFCHFKTWSDPISPDPIRDHLSRIRIVKGHQHYMK